MYDSGDFGPASFIPCERVLQALPELVGGGPDGGVARLYRLPGARDAWGSSAP